MSLMVFKTVAELTGDLTFVRVYSGVLTRRASRVPQPAYGQATSASGACLRIHANKREAVDEIHAGDIAAVMGLKQHGHRRHAVRRRQPDPAQQAIQFPDGGHLDGDRAQEGTGS